MAESDSKSNQGKQQTDLAEKIKSAYIDYLLENERPPASVYKFAKGLKIKEATFYKYYNSFQSIEKSIWHSFAKETIEAIKKEPVYADYSSREKLLSFYYTLIEVLKNNRSYTLYAVNYYPPIELTFKILQSFKNEFMNFCSEIVHEGVTAEEIMDRPYLSDRYTDGLWVQLMFILKFWVYDDSKDFEKTDEAIEKAVNLSFELMGKSSLDSILDFGKFLFQNRGPAFSV